LTKPKREPLSRLWFLSRGYTKADPAHVNGKVVWLHPETNDVLNQYGQKIPMRLVPYEKYKKNTTLYYVLSYQYGSVYLARLKYLTFKGEIPKGYTIDHIDGNTLNNSIRNLRAVTQAINSRDGGFLRKLRHKGIRPEDYAGVLLDYFERIAEFRATHSRYDYEHLSREEIMRLLVGPKFTIVSPDAVDDLFPEI
jgi:hypothetical protein